MLHLCLLSSHRSVTGYRINRHGPSPDLKSALISGQDAGKTPNSISPGSMAMFKV